MTSIATYNSANEYLSENLKFLETEEAVNSLIIGIAISLKDLKNNDNFYFSIKNNNEISVSGIKELAIKIGDCWTIKTGNSYTIGFKQLVYKLEKVNHIPDVQGILKKATPNDIALISKWFHQFITEAMNEDDEDAAYKMATKKIEAGEVFIWQDDTTVAMTSIARPTKNGISINYVYTPISQRGKGYGTKLVATLSKLMLKNGYKFCTLFTNIENPTSNNIYKKIGYRPVKEFRHIDF